MRDNERQTAVTRNHRAKNNPRSLFYSRRTLDIDIALIYNCIVIRGQETRQTDGNPY